MRLAPFVGGRVHDDVTEAKPAAELEMLVRTAAARNDDREMDISIRGLPGGTPNWDCTVQYANGHGWGPTPAFIKELAQLKSRFHLQD